MDSHQIQRYIGQLTAKGKKYPWAENPAVRKTRSSAVLGRNCGCDVDGSSDQSAFVEEVRLPLTWIALLRGRVGASLAATTGVESSTDLIKYLLAGADVVMTASALLRHGPEHAAVLLDGLCEWMGRKGYATVEKLRGLLAVPIGVDETARERGDYVSALRQVNSTDYAP